MNIKTKTIAAAVAAAMLLPAAPAFAKDNSRDKNRHEQNDRRDARGDTKQVRVVKVAANNHGKRVSQTAHKFRKGDKFDRRRATNYRVIDYRDYRSLKAPPRGYHYVQSGNDVLLVGITSGIVSAVVSNLLR